MKEYIEREALVESLRELYTQYKDLRNKVTSEYEKYEIRQREAMILDCISRVKNFPAVNIEETAHAGWKIIAKFPETANLLVQCPKCEANFTLPRIDFAQYYSYCPKCGKYME